MSKGVLGTARVWAIVVMCVVLFQAVGLAADLSFFVSVFGDQRTQVTRDIVAEFEARHPGVEIELIETQPGESEERLTLLIASGNVPDVMNLTAVNAPGIYASGIALPLDRYIERDRYDTSQIAPGVAEEYLRYQGKWYGMPYAGGILGDGVVYYNRDLFNEVGLPFPTYNAEKFAADWTWDEFRVVTQRLTDRGSDDRPTRFGLGFGPGRVRWHYKTWAWSNGAELLSPDRRTTLIDQPEFYEAIQWWADLKNVDRVYVDPPGQHRNMWVNGRLGIWEGSFVNIGQYAAEGLPFDWAVTTWPEGRNGTITRGTSLPLAISAKAQNPDLAWEFIKYILSDEVQYRLVIQEQTVPPQLLNIVQQPDFWNLPAAPHDLRPTVTPFARAEPASLSGWSDIDATIYQHVQAVWNGQESARAAMERAASVVNAMLRGQ